MGMGYSFLAQPLGTSSEKSSVQGLCTVRYTRALTFENLRVAAYIYVYICIYLSIYIYISVDEVATALRACNRYKV